MIRNNTLLDSGVLKLMTAHPRSAAQEEIVPDRRAELRPSEIVQAKLISLIPGMAVPISSQHITRETFRGNHS